MSQQHSGNVQPSIDREEHATAGGVDAKKVMVFDNAGNQIISFGGSGSGQATVTPKQAWPDPNTYIGLATVTPASNVTLNPSAAYIGLTTVIPSQAWPDPKGFIGLATVVGSLSFGGNVTLNPSPNYVGLATIDIGTNNNVALKGNVTLSDPKTFIGSVSVGGLVDSKGYIGLVTVTPGTAWPDPKTFIGLVTVTPASNITLNASAAFIGLVTIAGMSTVTLADPKGFIGLTTVVEAIPYSSPSIVHGMVSAASGALVQFAANAIKWVDVKASYGNATQVYVGGSLATINNGYPLMPGETIGMAISNTNQLYLVGVGTSECRFLAGN